MGLRNASLSSQAWWAAESKLNKGGGEQMLRSEQVWKFYFTTGEILHCLSENGLIEKMTESETRHNSGKMVAYFWSALRNSVCMKRKSPGTMGSAFKLRKEL